MPQYLASALATGPRKNAECVTGTTLVGIAGICITAHLLIETQTATHNAVSLCSLPPIAKIQEGVDVSWVRSICV
jgi:hypothetical protein